MKLGVVVTSVISAPERLRQDNPCEFEASMSYKVCSRLAWTTK